MHLLESEWERVIRGGAWRERPIRWPGVNSTIGWTVDTGLVLLSWEWSRPFCSPASRKSFAWLCFGCGKGRWKWRCWKWRFYWGNVKEWKPPLKKSPQTYRLTKVHKGEDFVGTKLKSWRPVTVLTCLNGSYSKVMNTTPTYNRLSCPHIRCYCSIWLSGFIMVICGLYFDFHVSNDSFLRFIPPLGTFP